MWRAKKGSSAASFLMAGDARSTIFRAKMPSLETGVQLFSSGVCFFCEKLNCYFLCVDTEIGVFEMSLKR